MQSLHRPLLFPAFFSRPIRAAAACDTIRGMTQTLSAALSDIALPDTGGREIRLGSLWAEQPAVVVFLRHYG